MARIRGVLAAIVLVLGVGPGRAQDMDISVEATVPITGRKQRLPMSQSVFDAIMGPRVQGIISSCRPSGSQKLFQLTGKAGLRILLAAGEDPRLWTTYLVESCEGRGAPNVMTYPGRQIVIFEGILPIAQDESGMAAILAHEVSHVLAHHPLEKAGAELRKIELSQYAPALMTVASGGNPLNYPTMDALYSSLFAMSVSLPLSRAQELEADFMSLTLLERAGYDPMAAPRALKRASRFVKDPTDKNPLSSYAYDHPSTRERIERLESAIRTRRSFSQLTDKLRKAIQDSGLLPRSR
ncbi:MAG: M48 family metallopeptidase [Elusimicrobia bacterium]|nr:M48 family metallopeptidase [Elusimicrobiota bacterium]